MAIVGVGLIGGSIGKTLLARNLARHVIGIGRRQASLDEAEAAGTVTSTTTELEQGVADADVVVVASPVANIVEHVVRAASACPTVALITDAGSTKVDIVTAAEAQLPPGNRFIGSHPLAGGERRGPAAAKANLFAGRTVVVTPTAATNPTALVDARRFWSLLGAEVVQLTPEEHDRALAITSHLPHLIAGGLAAALPQEYRPLAASGFRDTTRTAAGDAELWVQILMSNRENVLAGIDAFDAVIHTAREALQQGDADTLRQLLSKGKDSRDALGN
ncbi:MAG: prephenate dehydrogenase/arogenate dehydrogenase family protein [Planctomycetales bacterium]|nr:prephenate dehydrogenase/arogenate dehydrogenase family protein [Planctomycetales bacterium]